MQTDRRGGNEICQFVIISFSINIYFYEWNYDFPIIIIIKKKGSGFAFKFKFNYIERRNDATTTFTSVDVGAPIRIHNFPQ